MLCQIDIHSLGYSSERWSNARDFVQELEQALRNYTPEDKPSANQTSTLEQARRNLEMDLTTVNERYRHGLKLHDPLSPFLGSLDRDIRGFFAWLDCLPDESYESPLCSEQTHLAEV